MPISVLNVNLEVISILLVHHVLDVNKDVNNARVLRFVLLPVLALLLLRVMLLLVDLDVKAVIRLILMSVLNVSLGFYLFLVCVRIVGRGVRYVLQQVSALNVLQTPSLVEILARSAKEIARLALRQTPLNV